MISKLRIELKNNEVNIDKASLFQGVLMEMIDTNYAEKLHKDGVRPYTQSIINKDSKIYWQITTLNEKAHSEIMDRLMDASIKEVYLKHNRMNVALGRKHYEEMSYQEFVEQYLNTEESDIAVQFITPTSFKKEGKYYNLPDTRLIYSSIINKFNVFSGDGFNDSRNLVTELIKNTVISSYNLNSSVFRLEGTTVPSFEGSIEYRLPSDRRLKSIASMLLHYSEYCGIGTKTAIGMGATIVSD